MKFTFTLPRLMPMYVGRHSPITSWLLGREMNLYRWVSLPPGICFKCHPVTKDDNFCLFFFSWIHHCVIKYLTRFLSLPHTIEQYNRRKYYQYLHKMAEQKRTARFLDLISQVLGEQVSLKGRRGASGWLSGSRWDSHLQ